MTSLDKLKRQLTDELNEIKSDRNPDSYRFYVRGFYKNILDDIKKLEDEEYCSSLAEAGY